jgi:hypothetical protein
MRIALCRTVGRDVRKNINRPTGNWLGLSLAPRIYRIYLAAKEALSWLFFLRSLATEVASDDSNKTH